MDLVEVGGKFEASNFWFSLNVLFLLAEVPPGCQTLDVLSVARLEAFRALKLSRLESFRALKLIGQIGGV